jgi:CheY-like chemotaxis protein
LLLVANIALQRGVQRRQSLIAQLQQSERRLEETAQEADAANRAKSMFLSTMSHEIRTPLNAVLGYAQLMSRDPLLGADAKANLKIIGRSGAHLLALINDVLDMSKIEAGRTELHPVTFNLPQALKDLEAMFRLRAESKALEFRLLMEGETMAYVLADEGKIRQVLINLLGNAIKFTERGQVTLRVAVARRADGRIWLSASVEDTGLGISDEDKERVFEPFRQAGRGLYTQDGTGLGLAICRQNARLMGGDVTVTSEPGKGSTFLFETPVELGDAGVALKRSSARRVLGLRAGTKVPKVLVVDDQFENRDWLIKLLTAIGFSVRGAENGEAAIRSWEEWNPRLILMDVHMPVMDGLEATRRIRADPRGKETVIFTLTASTLYEDRQTTDQNGADDFLAKPCSEDELLEKMRAHLNIAYDYEDLGEDQPPAGLAALSAATLGLLPPGLIEELREATSWGNKRRLDDVILKVGETGDAQSAQALQELADRYDYDALTRLLEEAAVLGPPLALQPALPQPIHPQDRGVLADMEI